jgi:hypothetical protein
MHSQALWGRNLTRDSQADGVPMVHPASDEISRQRPSSFIHRTPEPCLRKSRGLGQSSSAVAPTAVLTAPKLIPRARFHNAFAEA